jgi:outer membrane protein TolC
MRSRPRVLRDAHRPAIRPARPRLVPHVLASVALAALGAGLFAAPLAAAPVTLADAERLALQRDPATAAYESEADAYRERAVAAKQLPDPEARVGAVNVPVDSFALNREDMTMLEVGVMQRFPRDRAPESRRLSALEQQQRAEADGRRRDVLKSVRVAWFEAAATRRTAEKLAEQRRWLEQMNAASRSMYASGEGGQADVLGARLERAMLEERELELRQMAAEQDAALGRWIGDETVPLAALELPRPAAPAPLATLEQRLMRHPGHAGAEAQVAAADAEVAMAHAKFKPEFAVDVGYGFRQGRMADGASRPDMLTAMVTFELPLFTKDRQRRELAAARAMQRAAGLMADDHARMLTMNLREAHAKATRAGQMLDLLERTVLPTARAAADAALASYRAGDGALDPVIAAARARLDAEIRQVRAQADLAVATAEIAALVGDDE